MRIRNWQGPGHAARAARFDAVLEGGSAVRIPVGDHPGHLSRHL